MFINKLNCHYVRTIRLFEAVMSLLVPYWLSRYLCGPIRGHHTNLPLVSCQTGTAISLTWNLVTEVGLKFLHISSASVYRCDGFQSKSFSCTPPWPRPTRRRPSQSSPSPSPSAGATGDSSTGPTFLPRDSFPNVTMQLVAASPHLDPRNLITSIKSGCVPLLER